jgi:toxin ParE1/3/4
MSSPNRYRLRLSRQAERDLESILQYTYETYGEWQMQIYAAALHEAFETITDNPGLGHRRSDLSERHRAFHVEHHFVVYVVYTVSGQTVNVSRILHERMDFTRHMRH